MSTALDFRRRARRPAKREARKPRAAGPAAAADRRRRGARRRCRRRRRRSATRPSSSTSARGARAGHGAATPEPAGRSLPRRRLLSVGGTPHPDGAWTEPLPPCLRALARGARPRSSPTGGSRTRRSSAEHVEGAGIAAHADGPLYERRAVIVSLESSAAPRLLHGRRRARGVGGCWARRARWRRARWRRARIGTSARGERWRGRRWHAWRRQARRRLAASWRRARRLHGFDEAQRPYFVMELLDGGSLADRIRDLRAAGRPPSDSEVREACRVVARIARAAATAQAAGIAVRDIKDHPALLFTDARRGLAS